MLNLFISVVLVVLHGFSHRIWLDQSAVVTNGDGLYLQPAALRMAQWGAWISSMSSTSVFGGPNFLPLRFIMSVLGQILAAIGGNEQMVNMVLYYLPISIVGPAAIYLFLYRITHDRLAALISSSFYLFNTLYLVYAAAGYPFVAVYSFVPLLFLLVEHFISVKKFSTGVFMILCFTIINYYAIYLAIIIYPMIIIYGYRRMRRAGDRQTGSPATVLKVIILSLLFFFSNFFLIVTANLPSIRDSVGISTTSRTLVKPGWLFWDNVITTYYPFWTGSQPTAFFREAIPWFYWLIPVYVFGSICFWKRNRVLRFFWIVAVLMAFLAKGPSEPFAWVYEWAFDYLPLFSIFRESSKFWLGTLFAFAVLLAFTISYLKGSVIKAAGNHKLLGQVMFIGLVLPIIMIIMATARPSFTQELGPGYISYSSPAKMTGLNDVLVEKLNYSRVLQVPAASRFVYFSEIHPKITWNQLPTRLQSLSPQVLRLLGIEYVVSPEDPFHEVYPGNSRREVYQALINQEKGLQPVKDKYDGSEGLLYANVLGSVPHIYPTNLVNFVTHNPQVYEFPVQSIFSHPLERLDQALSLYSNPQADVFLDKVSFVSDSRLNSSDLQSLIKNNSPEHIISVSCIDCEMKKYNEKVSYENLFTDEDKSYDLFAASYGVKNMQLEIDGQSVLLLRNKDWYYAKNVQLPAGQHQIKVILEQENVYQWSRIRESILVNSIDPVELFSAPTQPFHKYELSFRYKISGSNLNVKLNQNTDFYFQYQQGKDFGTPWYAYNGPLINDGAWQVFSTTFVTTSGAAKATVNLEMVTGGTSRVDLRDISLVPIVSPQILALSQNKTDFNERQLPGVVFRQMSPTRYLVRITSAHNPYYLVLAESFNKYWQARFLPQTADFFSGDALTTSMQSVREIPYANDLFFREIYAGNSGEEIPGHFQINDYANSWYIDRLGNYDLEIFFKPQADFLIGMAISFIGILTTVFLGISMFIIEKSTKG